jgi:uncharacterized protein (UPF0297 family)
VRYDSVGEYSGCKTNLVSGSNVKGEYINISHILKFGDTRIEISVQERDQIIEDLVASRDRLADPESNLNKNLKDQGYVVKFEEGRMYRA